MPIDTILTELFKNGALVACLGIAIYAIWGQNKGDRQALLDIYAKTVLDTVSALKDNTTAWKESAANDKLVSDTLHSLTEEIKELKRGKNV